MTMSTLCTLAFVVLAILDTLEAEDLLEVLLFRLILTIPPCLNSLKHDLLTLTILVTESGVVEDL